MNLDIASKIIDKGRQLGADFVEIFEEESRSSTLLLKDRKIENASASTEYGIGIRLIYGTEVLYAFTSDDHLDTLLRMTETLAFGRNQKGSSIKTLDYQSMKRFRLFSKCV